MTQFFADADNGINTADGLTITRSGTVSITSSSVADPTNILCVAHGMVSTESTTVAGHSGSTPAIDGDHVITRIDDDNFTIPVNVTTGGTGGTSQELDGPFVDMHQFVENTRSAGDILSCRRGTTAQYDDGDQMLATSDGVIDNPIILEADFDDHWSEDVTSSQTYNLVFGSKTHTASATITVLVAGEWIYNTTDGDDPREFAYEVASVSGTTLTLKIPYKGSTGATKSLTVMKANPVWGDVAVAFNATWDTDQFWLIQGITFTGNSIFGCVEIASSFCVIKDCIAIPGSGVTAWRTKISETLYFKCRFTGGNDTLFMLSNVVIEFYNCLFDGSPSGVSVHRDITGSFF